MAFRVVLVVALGFWLVVSAAAQETGDPPTDGAQVPDAATPTLVGDDSATTCLAPGWQTGLLPGDGMESGDTPALEPAIDGGESGLDPAVETAEGGLETDAAAAEAAT